MFVDASAMVAILTEEEEDVALFRCLDVAEHPLTSALAIFETASAVRRKKGLSAEAAEREVRGLLDQARIRVVSMTDAEVHSAFAAYALRQESRTPGSAQHGRLLRLWLRTDPRRFVAVCWQ